MFVIIVIYAYFIESSRWQRLDPFKTTHGQASVCGECRCTADLQSLSSGPHSAVTAQITLALDARSMSFQLAVPVYRCLHGSAPGYLASDLQRVSHLNAHRRLRSSTTHQRWSLYALCVLPLATAPFQWLLHRSGTVCRSQSSHCRRCKSFAADWKLNFLPGLKTWLRTSRCTDYYYVTSLFKLIVTCPFSLRT